MAGSWGKPKHIRREQLLPALELVPDIGIGEARLAAEAALTMLGGSALPVEIEVRAISTLAVLAGVPGFREMRGDASAALVPPEQPRLC